MSETNISMKVCTSCKLEQSKDSFSSDKNRADGKHLHCRTCNSVRMKARYAANRTEAQAARKADYEKNKDVYKARAVKWAQENREKRREISRAYARNNPEQRHEANKKHRIENPGVYAAHYKMRQQRLKKALPLWADHKAMEVFYIESARLTKETGVKHHVDHFYPLTSDIVCGLHNEFNLRVIPAHANLSKANSFPEELK